MAPPIWNLDDDEDVIALPSPSDTDMVPVRSDSSVPLVPSVYERVKPALKIKLGPRTSDEPPTKRQKTQEETSISKLQPTPEHHKAEDDIGAGQSADGRSRKEEKNVPLRELSAKDFVEKVKLFSGPQAIIHVDGEDFELPKALLCYYSSHFNAALNGGLKEELEQKVTLVDFKADIFRLVVQWLYQGQISLPSLEFSDDLAARVLELQERVETCNIGRRSQKHLRDALAEKKVEDSRKDDIITICTKFLDLASYLNLLGPFDNIVNIVKDIFNPDPSYFSSQHIRLAMDRPTNHPVREFFLQMAADGYIEYLLGPQDDPFKFQAEIDSLEGLAEVLQSEFANSFLKKEGVTRPRPKTYGFQITGSTGYTEYKITSKKIPYDK